MALINGTHAQTNSTGAEVPHTAVISHTGRNTHMTPGDISTILHCSSCKSTNTCPQKHSHRQAGKRLLLSLKPFLAKGCLLELGNWRKTLPLYSCLTASAQPPSTPRSGTIGHSTCLYLWPLSEILAAHQCRIKLLQPSFLSGCSLLKHQTMCFLLVLNSSTLC